MSFTIHMPEFDEHWRYLHEEGSVIIFKLFMVSNVEIEEEVEIRYNKEEFLSYLKKRLEDEKKGIKPIHKFFTR